MFHLGTMNMDKLSRADHPALEYYRLAMDIFGVPFGDPQVGRWNPTAVDFAKVYLDSDGNSNGTIDRVVDGILQVLEWINSTVGTSDFHHANIEKRFDECLKDWKEQKLTTLDIGEFRLMLAVQICCLAKVVVRGHKDLHHLVYPCKNKAAASQLAHISPPERPAMLSTILRETRLEEYGPNAAEGNLCETSETRVCKMNDVVFLGQMCFRHCVLTGQNLLKHYNSDTWDEF